MSLDQPGRTGGEGAGTVSVAASAGPEPPGGPAARFDAFLSYSQRADAGLAPTLQVEVERLGRPWHRPRARRLFRDQATLTPGPSLWGRLESALQSSRWYVLLACPQSAASEWVARELDWWLRHRGTDQLLLVVTEGTLGIDPVTGAVDPSATTCLPGFAAAALPVEPLWVDLTWTNHQPPGTAGADRFRNAVADIAAAVSGVAKDELVGENIRQSRRTRRLVRVVLITLSVLLLLAGTGGVIAVQQRNTAEKQLAQATSRQLVADAVAIRDTQPGLARQLILTAYRQAPTSAAVGAVLASGTIPAGADLPEVSTAQAADPVRNLYALLDRGGIEFHSADDAATVASVRLPDGRPTDLAYAGDGSLLAALDTLGRLDVWALTDPTRPELLGSVPLDLGTSFAGVAFLGRRHEAVVLASTGRLRLVDLSSPAHPRLRPVLDTAGVDRTTTDPATGLTVSSDGSRLTFCQGAQTFWEVTAAGRLRRIAALPAEVGCGTVSPDGYLLAVPTGYLVSLFDVADPTRPVRIAPLAGPQDRVSRMAFAPDSGTLAVGNEDGTVLLWDVTDPFRPRLSDQIAGLGGLVSGVVFAGDSTSLLAQVDGDQVSSGEAQPGILRIWPVRDGARSTQLGQIDDQPTQLSFAARRPVLVSGFPARVRDISDPRRPTSLGYVNAYNQGGRGLALDPDGTLLYAGDPLTVYDVSDPGRPRRLSPDKPSPEHEPELVLLAAARALVVSGGSDLHGPVALWDVADPGRPRLLTTLPQPGNGDLGTVALSPDGQRLAVLGNELVVVYDLSVPSRPRAVQTLRTPKASVLTFAGNGDTLAVGDSVGVLHVWTASGGGYAEVGSAQRHTGEIGGIAAHPSAPWLATGGSDGTVRLWDISDPAHPAELMVYAHGGVFDAASMSFSPDGRTLGTAAVRSTRLWDVDLPGLLAAACAASTDLTPEQWAAYLPQRRYDPPCR